MKGKKAETYERKNEKETRKFNDIETFKIMHIDPCFIRYTHWKDQAIFIEPKENIKKTQFIYFYSKIVDDDRGEIGRRNQLR